MTLISNAILASYKRCGGILGDASCRCGCRTTGDCFNGKRGAGTTAVLRRLVAVVGKASGTRRSLCVLNVACCGRNSFVATSRCFAACCGACPHKICARRTECFSKGTLFLSAPRPHLSRSDACGTVRRLRVFVRCFPADDHQRSTRRVVFSLRSGLIVGSCLTTGLCCSLNSCAKGDACDAANGGCLSYVIATRGTLGSCPCAGVHRSLSVLILHTGCSVTGTDIRRGGRRHVHRAVSRCCSFGGRFPSDGCAGRIRDVCGSTGGCMGRFGRWGWVEGCKLRGSGHSGWCYCP